MPNLPSIKRRLIGIFPFNVTSPATGISATAVLTALNPDNPGGTAAGIDLRETPYSRLVVESVVDSVTGTSPTLVVSALGYNNPFLNAPTTGTTYPVLAPDGSTALATASQNAAGSKAAAIGRLGNTAAGASNAGAFLTLLATLGGTTPNFVGNAYLYAEE